MAISLALLRYKIRCTGYLTTRRAAASIGVTRPPRRRMTLGVVAQAQT
jgi:hypothetical protein